MANLHQKIQNALNESRILILGSQILLGFQYRSFFENGFRAAPIHSRVLSLLALGLILITVGCVISPTIYHRLVLKGEDRSSLQGFAAKTMMIALIPFALAIGIVFFTAGEKITGREMGWLSAALAVSLAFFLWYGIPGILRLKQRPKMKPSSQTKSDEREATPLSDKIRHVLIETRVMLPGIQALLAFQLAIVWMEEFDKLSQALRELHLACLGLISISMILLMAPAAYHRMVDGGEETEGFHRFASIMIVTSSIPLGLALSGEFFIVILKTVGSLNAAFLGAGAVLILYFGLWFGIPVFHRTQKRARPTN